MKKYLLPKDGKFYKANLHCHSNVSDGKLTPVQIKNAYMEKGYSIVAYTDHDVLIPHTDLNDDNFLALHGYEMEVNETEGEWRYIKTCHMCLIALEQDNLEQVCFHRSKYLFRNAVKYRDVIKFDESEPDFEREHTHECVSKMMQKGREKGFFVTYNHPVWSLEDYSDYSGYEHMHAMEIYNHGSACCGYEEYNEQQYEEMLRMGKKIYCIAADDNHNHEEIPDSFGGFVMIKAPELEYDLVTDALVKGNFYASQGPEIYELWLEDGKVHIECSDVVKIVLQTDNRYMLVENAKEGNVINKADFEIDTNNKYFRITITDAAGKHANTNGYFIEDIYKEQ